jgi:branched-chain amino acid transport system permease protein
LIRKGIRNWTTVILFILLGLVPAATLAPYVIFVLNTVAINIILVLALNYILGFAGQVFLGTIAFFAVASYTYGLLFVKLGWGFWASLPFTILLTALLSLLIGLPTLRVRGAYLALMSMGFIIVVGDVLKNWMSFTGGVWGIPGIPRPALGTFILVENLHMFYLCWAFAFALAWLTILVEDSRFGTAFKAVRDDQLAVEMVGVSSTYLKVLAFVLCGVYTGVAGALFASFNVFISPEIFTFNYNSIFLCMLVVGGLSSVPGSVLGAILLTAAIEVLRPLREKYLTVFALLIILIMLFEPGGLVVFIEEATQKLRRLVGLIRGTAPTKEGGGARG